MGTPMFSDAKPLKTLKNAQDWMTQLNTELENLGSDVNGFYDPLKKVQVPGLTQKVNGIGQTLDGTVDSAGKVTPGLIGKVDALEKLTANKNLKLVDPNVATMFDANTTATPPGQTEDQHRLSITLPNSDTTAFHLGAQTTGGKDRGIRGLTDHHIHFETRGTPTPTLVSLGLRVKETAVKSPTNPSIPGAIDGYVMVTEGKAWQESKLKQTIHSEDEDVAVTTGGEGKTALLHSYLGKASVAARDEVAIGTQGNVWIGADMAGSVEMSKFDKGVEGTVGKWLCNKAEKTAMAVADVIVSIQAIMAKAASVQEKVKDGENGWEQETSWSKAKHLVDVGKVLSTVVRTAKDPDGKVSITATTFASLTGDVAASVFGNVSASLTSVVSASVLGGTASLKGLLWSSVWSGVSTSVKSLGDVEVKAEKGKLKLQGQTSVEVSCADGPLKLGGKHNTQVTADQQLYINGKETTAISAGSGPGYGALFQQTRVALGSFKEVNDADTCQPTDAQLLRMVDKDHISLHMGEDNGLRIEKYEIRLCRGTKKGIVITPEKTHIDNKRILLG